MKDRSEDRDAPQEHGSGGRRDDLKVFISHRESTCEECREELGRRAWIVLAGERGALCLACADLDHLAFLPSGNTALTRRAKKHSRLSAVVLQFSRNRGRYERQGVLVEEAALIQAESECLADEEQRQRRREREAERREVLDERYVAQFAEAVRGLYPACPAGREQVIAEHACRKYSGRIGRAATAKALDEHAIRLAVAAHVRHVETNYDQLLAKGYERYEARDRVAHQADRVLQAWATPLTVKPGAARRRDE